MASFPEPSELPVPIPEPASSTSSYLGEEGWAEVVFSGLLQDGELAHLEDWTVRLAKSGESVKSVTEILAVAVLDDTLTVTCTPGSNTLEAEVVTYTNNHNELRDHLHRPIPTFTIQPVGV